MRDLSAQRRATRSSAAAKEMPRTRILQIGALAVCGALLGQPALATSTERISIASDGSESDGNSYDPALSADGRFVAFESTSSDLVAGDTNGFHDVFVHDRLTGVTNRVSVASDGSEANKTSVDPDISANGRFVAFRSFASNLVADDTNGFADIFVRNRLTGVTERVSVNSAGEQTNGDSSAVRISTSGRFVVFASSASRLVDEDTNASADVFIRDRLDGRTARVSVASDGSQGNAKSDHPAISANGRFVAFDSGSTNLVAGDTNGSLDVFVHDRVTGATERVSVGSDGAEANYDCFSPSVSADGRFVTFISEASLTANDTNDNADIFVRDRLAGTTQRVSVASNGSESDGNSFGPAISADGRFVAFYSDAPNLVVGDTNGFYDVFVHDRLTGTTERVSVDSAGGQGSAISLDSAISADGRFVAFESDAPEACPGRYKCGEGRVRARSGPVAGRQ